MSRQGLSTLYGQTDYDLPPLAHNGLFRIDPRLQGNKLVDSQFKQYATKNDFSATATTESGKVVLASNKGDIRLFDQIGKNAKVSEMSSVELPQH